MRCGAFCRRVYRNQIKSVEELRQDERDSVDHASDRQCNQGMVQETVILHCNGLRTF